MILDLTKIVEFLYCNACKARIYDSDKIKAVILDFPNFCEGILHTHSKDSRNLEKNPSFFPDGFGLCPNKIDCGGRLIPFFHKEREIVEEFLSDFIENMDDSFHHRQALHSSVDAKFLGKLLRQIPMLLLSYIYLENRDKKPF